MRLSPLPAAAGRRPSDRRLPRPRPLPALVPTTGWGRALLRLRRLVGAA